MGLTIFPQGIPAPSVRGLRLAVLEEFNLTQSLPGLFQRLVRPAQIFAFARNHSVSATHLDDHRKSLPSEILSGPNSRTQSILYSSFGLRNLERFQELNHAVPVIFGKTLKILARDERFS